MIIYIFVSLFNLLKIEFQSKSDASDKGKAVQDKAAKEKVAKDKAAKDKVAKNNPTVDSTEDDSSFRTVDVSLNIFLSFFV